MTQAAAAAGDGAAMRQLAEFWRDGIGCTPNAAKAFERFAAAARLGDTPARYQLAMAYLNGDGTEQSPNAAIDELRTLAEQWHPDGCLTLGRLYLEGVFVERDAAEARKLIERAASKGSPL